MLLRKKKRERRDKVTIEVNPRRHINMISRMRTSNGENVFHLMDKIRITTGMILFRSLCCFLLREATNCKLFQYFLETAHVRLRLKLMSARAEKAELDRKFRVFPKKVHDFFFTFCCC